MGYTYSEVTYGIIGAGVKIVLGDTGHSWDIERTKKKDAKGNVVYIFWIKDKDGNLLYDKELEGVWRKDQIGIHECTAIVLTLAEIVRTKNKALESEG